jgi:hypothetical protein
VEVSVVALSGTLETFSLPDVLRLLSSTNKTGRLSLDGDRGRGCVWVEDGQVVAAEADRAGAGDVDGLVFELLRFVEAGFEFESGTVAADPGAPRTVDEVLAEGEQRLEEWREIEAVVPSLDIWARMVPEVDGEVRVSPEQWRTLAAIGAGASGHDLADRLGQGEYDVCRQLRDLVETGMVDVEEAAPQPEPAPVTSVEPVEVEALGPDLASFVAVGGTEADETPAEPETEAPATLVWGLEESPAEPAAAAEVEAVALHDDVDDLAGDVPDLSQLSPKAAAAVEATWSPDSPDALAEEALAAEEPAPGDPTAEDGDLDQNLLLRFLSTAKQ